jgi:hypothetical protein
MKKHNMIIHSFLLILLCVFFTPLTGFSQFDPVYFQYLDQDDHPKNDKPAFSEGVQGATHDRDYWYITNTWWLFRIPVWKDLKEVDRAQVFPPPGVDTSISVKCISDITELKKLGYNHFGDPDHYEYDGVGYILVPIEVQDADDVTKAIAFFKANKNLDYITYTPLAQGSRAAFCAVDPEGFLYTAGKDNTNTIHKYSVKWESLETASGLGSDLLRLCGVIQMLYCGNPVELNSIQGGEFTKEGDGLLFYLVNGYQEGGEQHPDWGLHVFDTKSLGRNLWEQIRRSTHEEMPFKYEFHPDCCEYEEPEGLTIWDLDDGRAPGIIGQLHVFLLNVEVGEDDGVYFKHYTNAIRVNSAFLGEGDGSPARPFKMINQAYDFAWDGSRIKVFQGRYRESITISKRLQLLSTGGTVIIGDKGQLSLYGSGSINLFTGGGLKIY